MSEIDQQLRILVAEDDVVSRRVLEKLLTAYGQITSVENGPRALLEFIHASLNNRPYDLVFLDLCMPGVSGEGVLKEIRSFEEANDVDFVEHTKVVIVTGSSDPKSILGAFRAGAESYLIKPVDKKKLGDALAKLGIGPVLPH